MPIRPRFDPRWPLAVALAVATALVVASSVRAADATRRAWGSTRAVAVATRDLHPGDVIAAGDVELRAWPLAIVPPGALEAVPDGRSVRAEVGAGQALVPGSVTGTAGSAAAAAVPDGWRGLAVAVGPAALRLAAGDVVDVYASGDPAAASTTAAELVAPRARVVAVDDRVVTIAVPDDEAATVAAATATGVVTLALVGAGADG